jgi:tRNA modification GTPase
VTTDITLDGWPVQLIDTAGLRTSDDAVEAAGVDRAKAELATADLVVLVFDRSQPQSVEDASLRQRYPQALLVANKSDLAPASPVARALATSAVNGEGLAAVQQAIVARLVPQVPPPGAAIPFTTEQRDSLVRVAAHIARGETAAARLELQTHAWR